MTDTEFLLYWELLLERYGRTPSAALTRMYALTLKAERLSRDEWGAAVQACIRFEQFWPSPQQLIDYARPSFRVTALAEWDGCMERVKRGEAATLPSTYTRVLMNRVTNGKPLGEVPTERLEWLKKEFLERYTEYLTDEAKSRTPALIAPQPARVLT